MFGLFFGLVVEVLVVVLVLRFLIVVGSDHGVLFTIMIEDALASSLSAAPIFYFLNVRKDIVPFALSVPHISLRLWLVGF
jgi:hypothetical protein